MVLLQTPAADIQFIAPDFELPDLDGTPISLSDVRGSHGTLVAFICNHCPYVQAIIDRFVADVQGLNNAGIGVVAIMPNDVTAYPQDNHDHMTLFAAQHAFDFPYLLDVTQSVAKAYGAVCTPDFFGFDAEDRLCYRGRLDAGTLGQPPEPDAPRELLEAMLLKVETGRCAQQQMPSMGCSIKWKAAG